MELMLLPEDGFVEPVDIKCNDLKLPSSAWRGAEIVVKGIKAGYRAAFTVVDEWSDPHA